MTEVKNVTHRNLKTTFCALIFCFVNQVNAQTSPELLIGVVPNVSARIILQNYQPLADYLQDGLKRKASIVTSTDFASFHQRVLKGEFHLIVTAPNLGRVAEVDGKWETLAVLEPQIPALLVGLASKPDSKIAELRGKKLALANPSSLVAIAGINWLSSQGLSAERDYEILRIANDDSLGLALRTGEAPFAMMSMGEFRAKPPELQKDLKIITEFIRVPGFFIMINPKLSASDKSRLSQLIGELPSKDAGKKFLASSGFQGLHSPTPEERRVLDGFLDLTRKGVLPTPK